ncbi:hypothetical protein ABH926_006876 [Catenulispora sp. GP43]
MDSRPETNGPQKTPPPSREHLEEMTEQTAETMASARRDVARAKATLHDQILSDLPDTVGTDAEEGTSSASADSESASESA